MRRAGRRRLGLTCVAFVACLLVFLGTALAADEWRVVRNVRLLTKPSSATGQRIKTLHKPEIVEGTPTPPSGNYIHVVDSVGDEGWVYKPFLEQVAVEEPTNEGTPGEESSGGTASVISTSWAKPQPNTTEFVNADGVHCGPTGDGDEVDTNRRKNRTDVPAAYHTVTFDAIDQLPYPVAPKHRSDWTASQIAQIEPYEGVALTVTGYLAAIKQQSGESCNCGMTHAAETDWHMSLVEHRGDGEADGFVVETTPRVRRDHPLWTKGRLDPWLDGDDPVRISGWLMLDPEHRPHLGTFRNTLWEIHPITRIEVFANGAWSDLDVLP